MSTLPPRVRQHVPGVLGLVMGIGVRRIAASSLAIRSVAGLSSPGSSVATTIAFFEVSSPETD